MIRRLGALGALAVAVVVMLGAPASAHPSLVSSTPSNGGVDTTAPKAVTLRFDEAVEVSLGGLRVYDSDHDRVVTGEPRHPNGDQREVSVSLPALDDGTYVVTWRVTSADSHPVGGAYTFQVGTTATLSNERARGLAASLLAANGGSQSVGVVYGIDRAVLFVGLALLLGGAVFVVVLWPAGRDRRGARRMVWIGWWTIVVTTLFGIALEGIYAAAFPLGDVFDPTVLRDTLDTRFGHVSLVRLGLLALAVPLLRQLFRRPAAEHPLGRGWDASALLVGAGIAVTPGLAGHAGTGIQTGLAIPADLLHVSAMACWVGGLVVLSVVVLPRRDLAEMRAVVPRFSTLALGSVIALVATGAYQAWRQVGSFGALKSTDYGKLLVAKLIVFALLVVAAALTREVVNRRFRSLPPDDDAEIAVDAEDVLVGTGSVATAAGPRPFGAGGRVPAGDGVDGERDDERDEPTDEEEISRLRRSVWIEVVLAVLVLAVTALLVNAAPARSASTEPISLTLESNLVWVYVDVVPAAAGPNDLHFTSFPTGGGPATVTGMTVQLTRPGENLSPFEVPLQKLGPGHYWAPQYTIPYSGTWQATVRVQLGTTDEAVLLGRFDLR